MFRKLVATLGVALACLLATASPAAAEPYPAPAPPLSVSSTAVGVGGTVTISGTGYIPNEPVVITVTVTPFLASPLRGPGALALADFSLSTTADSSGSFTAEVPLGDVAGMASIVAVGQISGVTTSVMVRVGEPTVPNPAYPAPTEGGVPAAPPADNASGGGLSNTGAGVNVAAMLSVGVGVVLAGIALVVFGARGAFGRKVSAVRSH